MKKLKLKPEEYVLHSGGAKGSDQMFSIIGEEFGLIKFNHYWYGKMNPYSKLTDKISDDDYQEGIHKIYEVNKILNRKNIDKYMYLLARNWCQVKYSDATYAIGKIKNNKVQGGTGYAAHLTILEDKPVYVYEQNKKQWYFWHEKSFEVCVTPVLVKDFAGIGTREINDDGVQAIRNVYEKTFGKV